MIESKVFEEQWAEFHPGLEISNTGKVRSYFKAGHGVRRETTLPRRASIDKQGCPIISFASKSSLIKTLVATHFMKYDGKSKIINKDGNRKNCHVKNLKVLFGVSKSNKCHEQKKEVA